MFPGVIKSGLYDAFKKVYQSSKPTHHPITLYKDERIEHWMENYIYKLSSGEIVSVYDDITEKKLLQQQHLTSEKLASIGLL